MKIEDRNILEEVLVEKLMEAEASQDAALFLRGKRERVDFAEVVSDADGDCRGSVDEYDGPKGPGYAVVLEFVADGQTWRRTVQVGPEPVREHDWLDVTDLKRKAILKG